MRTTLLLLLAASSAGAQVVRVAELTADQIRALDRQKTVVLLPAGVLEQHGPHLPSYADGYQNERLTGAVAAAVAQRSGWKALVFPPIPLGTAGANEIGGVYSWPGTYSIRASTLRAVFMDLADELGTQGFRWAFIIHGHGAPRHNVALDQVEDYFRDTYGGRMVHLMGREPDMSAYDAEYARRVTTPFGREDGDSPHAGLVETSIIAYLRPDLLVPSYKQLGSLTPAARDRLAEVATAPGWPGYFGAPRFATAEIGRFLVEVKGQEYVKLAMRILDGLDERSVPRYADMILEIPGVRAANDRALEHERAIAKRQDDWMSSHAATPARDSVDESAIVAARSRWNRAVAAHDAAAYRRLLSPTYGAGGGFGHVAGVDSAVVAAARLFRQRPDLEHEARPIRIRVVASHGIASEFGEWVEHWTEPTGRTEMRGTYYTVWRRLNGSWMIEAESNTPESCTGSDYCKPPKPR